MDAIRIQVRRDNDVSVPTADVQAMCRECGTSKHHPTTVPRSQRIIWRMGSVAAVRRACSMRQLLRQSWPAGKSQLVKCMAASATAWRRIWCVKYKELYHLATQLCYVHTELKYVISVSRSISDSKIWEWRKGVRPHSRNIWLWNSG
jgi:hypothetical protein